MLQQEYSIIGLEKVLRKIKLRCVKSGQRNAIPTPPKIADLPRERDEPVFPFAHTGVDFLEPIEVKFLRRTLKSECCLFTYIHIGFAQSLDTEALLAAITRLVARRGYLKTIISDISR